MPGIADILALAIAILLIGAAHYYRVTRRAARLSRVRITTQGSEPTPTWNSTGEYVTVDCE